MCDLTVGMRCVTACITVLWEGALSIDCDGDSDDKVMMIVMVSDDDSDDKLMMIVMVSDDDSDDKVMIVMVSDEVLAHYCVHSSAHLPTQQHNNNNNNKLCMFCVMTFSIGYS